MNEHKPWDRKPATPTTDPTPDDLQMLAAHYRRMAKAASTPDEANRLTRLAELYAVLAARALRPGKA